jgi:hypothetical protein
MNFRFNKSQVALAVVAALSAGAFSVAPTVAEAAKTPGKYVAGDFHNHTTCSDGQLSMQKLVNKSVDTWALDWFVQAGHGGSNTTNCTLVEDATLGTPAYPYDASKSPSTTWTASGATIKGNLTGGKMPRWQTLQEFQYKVMEYLNVYKNKPMFIGLESVVAGHEHTSMAVIAGQMPNSIQSQSLPTTGIAPYTQIGNADALSQWTYCFDRGDYDNSRGASNLWSCGVTGSLNSANTSWDPVAMKLNPGSGTGVGTRGHEKTVEGVKWMAQNYPQQSYYVPAHLERAGTFYADGQFGFNIEHLRNFNNAGPTVAFGFESQPGHGASSNRGEIQVLRNNFGAAGNFDTGGGVKVSVDSVGGTTYGGTGVYASQIGGVWDALLGEGRNWWFFASSDWHNRGSFGADDRRSTQDFQPGEYQRNYTLVRNNSAKLNPQTIVDGLRTGNTFAPSGQLIDRLAFVACVSYPTAPKTNAAVEAIAVAAATNNTDTDSAGCATMGEKLKIRSGGELVVTIVVRDPSGANNSPYTFNNPSLAQVGVSQPLNYPVLNHVDVIQGLVSGYKTPGAADYSGAWPQNTNWLKADGTTYDLTVVPAAAKNTSAAVVKTWNSSTWTSIGGDMMKMTFRIPAVTTSRYVRLRGTNMPAGVPYETDANGNPLSDIYTNAGNTKMLRIPCSVTGGSTQFDQCPTHMATATSGSSSPIVGQKAVSYDVAAWADLWFYSNPIYVEVAGSTVVAGVQ